MIVHSTPLNRPSPLDIGFVILSPEPNIGRLTSTIRSINKNYGEHFPRLCVVSKKTPTGVLNECKKTCLCVRGQNTITSLINTGMKKGHKHWNIIVLEGTYVRSNFHHKYTNFLKDNKDIFFPIVPDYNRDGIPIKLNNSFPEATLNGMCIHQETFKNVGDFGDEESIEYAKLIWAAKAKEKGCLFKAVLGLRTC